MSLEQQIRKSLGNEGYKQYKKVASQAAELRYQQKMINEAQLKALKKKINSVDKIEVSVGIPQHYSSRGDEALNNAEILYIQTNGTTKRKARNEVEQQIKKGFSGSYGTARQKAFQMYMMEHGSPAYGIPPRPVIEPALMSIKNKIGKLLGESFKNYISGDDEGAKETLTQLGLMCQSECKKWFENPKNNWPPLAPSTIKARKEKHKEVPDYVPIPLVDTGNLRSSITYVVDYPRTSQIIGEKTSIIEEE